MTSNTPNTEIIIPKIKKTSRKHLNGILAPTNSKGMFDTAAFEQSTRTYEIVTSARKDVGEKLLRAHSPPLYAFLNQNQKKKSITKPQGDSSHSATNMVASLISRKPLSSLKNPIPTGVEAIEKEKEVEIQSISFKDDPITYFSKKKDIGGHRFIYMVYAGDKSDPDFSPYELVKVSSAEVGTDYFTMSANGVTHIMPDGNTENFHIDSWVKESSIYVAIKKLKTFKNYFHWKPFRIWKNFVMGRRYDQIMEKVFAHSFFNNYAFYESALITLQRTSDDILQRLLLSFHPQKMYSVEKFRNVTRENIAQLKEEYGAFMSDIIQSVAQLDEDIRDPQRLVVNDNDFPEIKRRNPNMGQLMALERKKYAETNRRIDIVKNEVLAFGSYVRLIDYVLLERLARSCFECWVALRAEISADSSSIFAIQVSFSDDGDVVFTPSLDVLLDAVNFALDESLNALNSLPKVISSPDLREHLKESIPDLTKLLDSGPTFKDFISPNEYMDVIRQYVIHVITDAFNSAYDSAQIYKEYFPIYRTGITWSLDDYMQKRGGESGPIDLTFGFASNDVNQHEQLIFSPADEFVVDFTRIRDDMVRFRNDEVKMNSFRSVTLIGALYIDSRALRTHLMPIPTRVQQGIQDMLQDLVDNKIEYFKNIFKHCATYFKKDHLSLETYVDFCQFLDRCNELTPHLDAEVRLIDELIDLFDELNLPFKQENPEREKNPLHSLYQAYKQDVETAANTRRIHEKVFVEMLEERIVTTQTELSQHNKTVTTIPEQIESCDVDNTLPIIIKAKEDIIKLEPTIKTLCYCQKVLGTMVNDFSSFDDVKDGALFSQRLFESVGAWKVLSADIKSLPIASIDAAKFKSDILSLDSELRELAEQKFADKPLLNQLLACVDRVVPLLDSLQILCNGRMQPHHWIKLFQACGKPDAFYSQIKIEELIELGILSQKEKIIEVTSISQGESQLETEFQAINAHWSDARLPVVENEKDVDTITLGDLTILFEQIADAQITLDEMLSIPFVQGIKESVLSLSAKLENIAKILDQWVVFQNNWSILQPLFELDDVRSILPQQSSEFDEVEKKWQNIVKNAKENKELFKICSYPSLLDIFQENNECLLRILTSVSVYLDKRRSLCPRLYFISNQEILSLLTTQDFKVFNHQLTKLFMHYKFFKSQINEISECSDRFGKQVFNGIIGDDGDSLPFVDPVSCTSDDLPGLVNTLIDKIKSNVKDCLANSIARYQSSSIGDWIPTVSTYMAILTLQVSFTREIEECFINLESNSRAFLLYENVLQNKIAEISGLMSSPLSSSELLRLSAISTFLNFHVGQIRPLSESFDCYSSKMYWNQHLRFRFIQQNWSLFIDVGDQTIEHGYEFWGSSIQHVYTPASERAMNNIVQSLMNGKFSLLLGAEDVGKKHLLMHIASVFGNFVYFFPAYQYTPQYYIDHVFLGAALSGCWIAFNNIDRLSHKNLSSLYNIIQQFVSTQLSGGSRMTLNGKVFEVKKTTKILLSGNSSFFTKESIPPELRSTLKPIALAAPDCLMIANIKLISSGFKYTKILAAKTHSLLVTIIRTFDYIQNTSFLSYVFVILNDAYDLLRQFMHTKGVDFVDYYENPREAEEYSIARAVYMRFSPIIKDSHHEILLNIIYTNFHIFTCFEDFRKLLINPGCFSVEQAAAYITNAVRQETEGLESEIPVDYITQQVVRLYMMMTKFPCIIITGGPDSGKSYVVEMLRKTFARLSRDADVINRFSLIRPIKMVDIYHASESYKGLFGSFKNDGDNGYVPHYGKLQAALASLQTKENTEHCLLRFSGPMTPEFVGYIQELLSSTLSRKCRISTMDTVVLDPNFHIIIETEDIANLSPTTVAMCGILPMQLDRNVTYLLNQEFSRSEFSAEYKDAIFKVLQEVTPKFVEKAVEDGHWMIFDPITERGEYKVKSIMLRNAIKLASDLHKHYDIDISSEVSLKNLFVYSLFTIFSQAMKFEHKADFDVWCRETFSIQLPNQWTDQRIPDHCKIKYPSPSLYAMRPRNDDFVPLDFDRTIQGPLCSIRDIPFQQTIEYVSVCTPIMLPTLQIMEIMIKKNRNVLIHGPTGSGKTSLVRMFFKNNPDFIPLYIPVYPSSNAQTLLDFIQTHTPVVTKNYAMMKSHRKYVLIFEDLLPIHAKALEFIRRVLTKKSVTITSKVDQNFSDELPLRNVVIIVTCESTNYLALRLQKNLISLRIEPEDFKKDMNTYVEISNYFGISKNFNELTNSLFHKLNEYNLNLCYRNCLEIFPFVSERDCQDEEYILNQLRILIEQAEFATNPVTVEDRENFRKAINESFSSPEFGVVLEEFGSGAIFFTRLETNPDMTQIKGTIQKLTLDDMKSEMSKNIESFNSVFTEKLNLFITSNVICNYLHICRALTYPGGNAVLVSSPSCGRRSLCRLFAYSNNYDFEEILPLPILHDSSKKIHVRNLNARMRKIIMEAVVEKKKKLIFIRSSENNQNDILDLLTFMRRNEFTQFYTNTQLIEFYQKFTGNQKLTQDQMFNAYRTITMIIRNMIHVVITHDKSSNSTWTHGIYEIRFIDDATPESVKQKLSSHSDLSNVFADIQCFVKGVKADLIGDNMLNSFLTLFMNTFGRFSSRLEQYNSNSQKCLNFYDKVQSMLAETNKEIENMTPDLESLREKQESQEKEYDKKRREIQEKVDRLDGEENEFVNEIQKIGASIEEYQQALTQAMSDASSAKEKVDTMTESDIQILQLTAENPPDKLKIFIKIICLFVGIDPEHKTYGKILFQSSRFLNELSSKIDLEVISEDVSCNVRTMYTGSELSQSYMDEISPQLGLLFAWISKVILCLTLKNDISLAETAREAKQDELQKYRESTKSDRDSIAEVQRSLEEEVASMESQNSALLDIENKYNTAVNIRNSLAGLSVDSDVITRRWKEGSETRDESRVLGNAIVYSAYSTYAGFLDGAERILFSDFLEETLNKSGILYDKCIDLEFTVARKAALLSPEHSRSNDMDSFIIEHSAHLALTSLNIPLILDPSGSVMAYLEDVFKDQAISRVSVFSSRLEEIIVESSSLGNVLFIMDVNDTHPLFESLYGIGAYKDQVQKGGNITDMSIRFKPFLFSGACSVDELPPKLLQRVSLINATCELLEGPKLSIISVFASYINPSYKGKIFSERLTNLRREVGIDRLEESMMKNICSSEELVVENISPILNDKKAIIDLTKSVAIPISELEAVLEPLKETYLLVLSMWETLTTFLPTIDKSYRFSLTGFLAAINQGFRASNLAIIKPDVVPVIHSSIVSSVVKFVVQQMPFNIGLLFLFVSAFFKGVYDGQYKKEDLNSIKDRIFESIDTHAKLLPEDPMASFAQPIETLKECNISDVFNLVTRIIEQVFGSDYTSYFPTFSLNSFIGSNVNTPTLIIFDKTDDPTPLLDFFVISKSRIDSFETFNISNDPETLVDVVNSIISSLAKSVWICIHYSDPSPATGAAIGQIYDFVINGNPSNSSRVVFLSNTTEFLPSYFLSKCERYAFSTFPSIKHQMLQIYQHHSSTIRSSFNPKAIKKLSYAISILYSSINYRNFFGPLGFEEFFVMPEITIREFIEFLRPIIDDQDQTQIPIRNIRDKIQETILGGCLLGTFDRRKLRCHVFTIFSPELLEDGFTFVDSNSAEVDLWTIPPDAPISNYTHIIQKLPVFASGDVLMMQPVFSQPLKNWLLSDWFSRPLLKFAPKPALEVGLDNIEFMLSSLPKPSNIHLSKNCENILDVYVLSQYVQLNKALEVIHKELESHSVELISKLSSGTIPDEWKEIVNYSGCFSVQSFTNYMKERHLLISSWLQHGKPEVISVRLITNIRGLILSFLHFVAALHNVSADQMMLEFNFDQDPSPDTLNLSDIYLMCGEYNIEKNRLTFPSLSTRFFTKMPTLVVSVVKRTQRNTSSRPFLCPLFYSVPDKRLMLKKEKIRVDGELENFVRYIPICSDVSDRTLVTTGTALICHLNEKFI